MLQARSAAARNLLACEGGPAAPRLRIERCRPALRPQRVGPTSPTWVGVPLLRSVAVSGFWRCGTVSPPDVTTGTSTPKQRSQTSTTAPQPIHRRASARQQAADQGPEAQLAADGGIGRYRAALRNKPISPAKAVTQRWPRPARRDRPAKRFTGNDQRQTAIPAHENRWCFHSARVEQGKQPRPDRQGALPTPKAVDRPSNYRRPLLARPHRRTATAQTAKRTHFRAPSHRLRVSGALAHPNPTRRGSPTSSTPRSASPGLELRTFRQPNSASRPVAT